MLQNQIETARVQAVRARDELQRAGACEEFGPRLAALEAAISTTSQALQWRKKALEEIGAVLRCVELAQVEIANQSGGNNLLPVFYCASCLKNSRVLFCCNFALQAGGNRELIKDAAQHVLAAGAAMKNASKDEDLQKKMTAAELALSLAEAWAKACDDGESAVKRAREALAAGNRDEAAGHCRQARGLLDGGLKNESLAGEVKDLEQTLKAGTCTCVPDLSKIAEISRNSVT